jgi:diguanylate cyclase (GGDEF)-like protein
MVRKVAFGALGAALLVYPLLPMRSVVQDVWYLAIAGGALGVAALGIRAHRPRQPRSWALLLAGLALGFAGDVTWVVLRSFLDMVPSPSAGDLIASAGYPLIVAGLCGLVRGRHRGRDRAALLDAMMFATGIGVLAAVFVAQPAITAGHAGKLAAVAAAAHPLAELLFLAILAGLWGTPVRSLRAYRALVASFAFFLVGDVGIMVLTLDGRAEPGTPVVALMLLLGYVGAAVAMTAPSMRTLPDPTPEREETLSRMRLAALGAAAVLAPLALVVQGLRGQPLYWQVIGPGTVLLSALVFARMAVLLQQVQRQAVQLAALARNDGLTGLPNRRTWDHEVSRACAGTPEDGAPVCVALLDLDHFKDFNDAWGHTAGDRLLAGAAAAWRSVLPDDVFLARYGGEEFGLLFRGRTTDEAYRLVEAMRPMTPSGQTFSAGLARWDGAEPPAALVDRADAHLYDAKRSGRARTSPAHS